MSVDKAFEGTVVIGRAEIDQLGHVNNIKYLQWVQDVAVAHWTAVASEEEQRSFLWVVLRHEIDYKQPAFEGDKLTVRTWVGNATKLRFERHTEFVRQGDFKLIAKALTIWCPVDAKTMRPIAVTAGIRTAFSQTEGR